MKRNEQENVFITRTHKKNVYQSESESVFLSRVYDDRYLEYESSLRACRPEPSFTPTTRYIARERERERERERGKIHDERTENFSVQSYRKRTRIESNNTN